MAFVVVVVQLLSHAQLFVTPWTIVCWAPLPMEFSRQNYQSRVPFPTLEELLDPGFKPTTLASPALAGGFFTTSTIWEAPCRYVSSVQLHSFDWIFVTPWAAECQTSLSITNYSQSLLKLMSIESVIPSNHLNFCCPLFLLPLTFPSTRDSFNESSVCIK